MKPTADGLNELAIVFSDLDGTLIHYPTGSAKCFSSDESKRHLQLPESSTGMVGIISVETLRLCQEIRRNKVKLVLVSGMRTSTLITRLPYLPKADAYCSEAGGRIFFVDNTSCQGESFHVDPKPYDGALEEDLEPFSLVEDLKWRKRMEESLGMKLSVTHSDAPMPISQRTGTLWRHAQLLEEKGFTLDTNGYSTCFRVNRKHQTREIDFDALLEGKIAWPQELGTSTNLGCVDFYPAESGKKNW